MIISHGKSNIKAQRQTSLLLVKMLLNILSATILYWPKLRYSCQYFQSNIYMVRISEKTNENTNIINEITCAYRNSHVTSKKNHTASCSNMILQSKEIKIFSSASIFPVKTADFVLSGDSDALWTKFSVSFQTLKTWSTTSSIILGCSTRK